MPSPNGFREAESKWGHIASSSASTASGSNPDTPTKKKESVNIGFLLFYYIAHILNTEGCT